MGNCYYTISMDGFSICIQIAGKPFEEVFGMLLKAFHTISFLPRCVFVISATILVSTPLKRR